ncbi:MAG TPA: UDP-3-O-(3-hydroxymyristoyl)glucosamine N-acyltransferase [Candidatus Krumholzibacteria bacterium]
MGERCYKLGELAVLVGGELEGDADLVIRGVAGIREAQPGDITFVANPRYEEFVEATRASAILAGHGLSAGIPLVRVNDPYYAYFQVLNLFAGDTAARYARGVHPQASIDPAARIGSDVCIGPFCHVGAGASIGDGTTLVAGVFVGDGARVGERCLIYSHVTIREGCRIGDRVILQPGVVVGSDGFGFARKGASYQKIPQIGIVVIEDDVELGANTCVDRATTGETRIRRGTKIDNLVQIAHNVALGEDTVIAAQTGISGSTEVGRGVVMGGQVGVGGHVTVGDGAVVGAQAGVTKSVAPGTTVSGYPAREHSAARRIQAHIAMLPELFRRVKALERRLLEREKGGENGTTATDDRE